MLDVSELEFTEEDTKDAALTKKANLGLAHGDVHAALLCRDTTCSALWGKLFTGLSLFFGDLINSFSYS